MKKSLVLLFIFSFVLAQSTIPSGNVVDPETQTSEGSAQLPTDVTDDDSLSAPFHPSSPTPFQYVIESGDLLEIIILGEEELSRTLMVMHNGTVSFPLIGEAKVAGLTTEQAAELLVERLKKYFTQPVVSIIFKSPTLPYVSVFGEVLRQGAVEYQRGLRVTDYIALAGGPTTKANLSKVKVVRFQAEVPLATTINVNDILDKGMLDKNFELKSGDWIHIDKKFTINWGAVLQFATLTLTALNLYITIQRLD